MSHQATNAVLQSPPQREYTDRLVMLALADEARSDGANCWPGLDRLSTRAGMPYRTCQDAIGRLEEDGWISVHRQRGKGSHYVLNLPHLEDPNDRGGWKCATCWDLATSADRPRPWATDDPVDNPQTDTVTVSPPAEDPHGDRVTPEEGPTRLTVSHPHDPPCHTHTAHRVRPGSDPGLDPPPPPRATGSQQPPPVDNPTEEEGQSRGRRASLDRADAAELLTLLGMPDVAPSRKLARAMRHADHRGWDPTGLAARRDVRAPLDDARDVCAVLAARIDLIGDRNADRLAVGRGNVDAAIWFATAWHAADWADVRRRLEADGHPPGDIDAAHAAWTDEQDAAA